MISVAPGSIADGVLEAARERFAGRAEVTISHPRFLEFLAPGVSKGVATAWLARRAGVPMSAVLAIGDQFNDLEMIAAAGHGAAMPHAPAAVRAAGRYLAPPLAEEGVAQLIEQLVLATIRGPLPRAAARFAAEVPRAGAGVTAIVVPDDASGYAAAIRVLRDGGIVALPTDTVYGIGVALDAERGIERAVRGEAAARRTGRSCCSSTTPTRREPSRPGRRPPPRSPARSGRAA